jgi:uncharacterized protein Usg
MSYSGLEKPDNAMINNKSSRDFVIQLQNYRLTTAEILYHLPDHPSLLQAFVWQELDLAPQFPVLHKFLKFWEAKLEGKLYRVKVAHQELIKPSDFHYNDGELVLH